MSITITNLIDKARNEFSGIIGLDLSSLVGMSKDNSHWKVIMEMVEKTLYSRSNGHFGNL